MGSSSDMRLVPERLVLEGVPRVEFYRGKRCPEDVPYPSCLRAVLEHMGEGVGCRYVQAKKPARSCGCTYAYLMGTSGAAFRFSWGEGWQGDNVEIMYMSDDPDAPFARAQASVGLDCEEILVSEEHDEAFFRHRIAESLGRGVPVLYFGVIGPPECCIVTGYDEGGDVLIGWNFFQGFPEFADGVDFEPSGCFRKRSWFRGTDDTIFVIKGVGSPPSFGDAYRDALGWGLQVMRTPEVTIYGGKRWNGLAAFGAWEEQLLRDEQFSTDDEGVLRHYHSVHDDAVGTIAEGRWYGSMFLAQAAQWVDKMATELYAAAACFAAEHDLMWKIWALVGGNGNPEAFHELAKPDVRRQIVEVIRETRAQNAAAADHIERALAKV